MIGGETFNSGEKSPREVNEARGEKVLGAREAEIMRRWNELEEEKRKLQAEIEALSSGKTIEDGGGAEKEEPVEPVETVGEIEEKPVDGVEEQPEQPVSQVEVEEPVPVVNVSAEVPENNVETEHEAKVERVKNKAKKNGAFRKKVVPIVTAAVAAVILLTSAVWMHNRPAAPVQEPVAVEMAVDNEEEETIGIYDGYGEKGMWLSENKGGFYRFACGQEVLEETDGDVTEAVKYTARNQSESFADYLAGLPSSVQPNDFKGASILESEGKLESMSDEDYEVVQENFDLIMDNALTRDVTLNGSYDNAFMRLKDTGKAVDHNNMELVHCVTNEKGTKATEFYWVDKDGKEIGSMIVKVAMNEDGGAGCIQVVKEKGTSAVYQGLKDVTDEGEPGTPGEEQKTPDDDPGTPEDGPGTPGENPENPENPETPENPDAPDTPETPDEPEQPEIAPKDEENLIRIDEQIEEDIEDDIHTEDLVITSTEEVKQEDLTEKPAPEVYNGTKPTFVQNEASKEAEPIQETISEVNDYGEDKAPENYVPEELPVQSNEAAQEQADQEQANNQAATLEEAVNNFGFN